MRIFGIILIFYYTTSCFSQDTLLPLPEVELYKTNPKLVRKYFFENVNFSKEGKELVVIVKEPQTKLAGDLGYRIYSDTSFLNKIESEFYREIDPSKEIAHFCGHDIYFYIKSGRNLKFYKQINSHCGINEIGCKNVDLLIENGIILHADSLKTLDFENLKPKEIIKDDVIYAELISSYGIWQEEYQPLFYNNCGKPNWLYDGKFQTTIEVDNVTPVDIYIQLFFSHVDSIEFKNINYELEFEDEQQLHVFNNTSTRLSKLRLNVYLDKDCFQYFSEYTIEPNNTNKKKIELQDEIMILIK